MLGFRHAWAMAGAIYFLERPGTHVVVVGVGARYLPVQLSSTKPPTTSGYSIDLDADPDILKNKKVRRYAVGSLNALVTLWFLLLADPLIRTM